MWQTGEWQPEKLSRAALSRMYRAHLPPAGQLSAYARSQAILGMLCTVLRNLQFEVVKKTAYIAALDVERYIHNKRDGDMTDWNRKKAESLASALRSHLSKKPGLPTLDATLFAICEDAKRTYLRTSSGSPKLDSVRANLCAICRNQQFYVCDVVQGWSSSCAFVASNS